MKPSLLRCCVAVAAAVVLAAPATASAVPEFLDRPSAEELYKRTFRPHCASVALAEYRALWRWPDFQALAAGHRAGRACERLGSPLAGLEFVPLALPRP